MKKRRWMTAVLACALVIGLLTGSAAGSAGQDQIRLSYLEAHVGEYDAYFIRCTDSGVCPTEALDRYFGNTFYNMVLEGDFYDVSRLCTWLTRQGTVKSLVLSISPEDLTRPVNRESTDDPETVGDTWTIRAANERVTRRDAEPIGSAEDYLKAHPVFQTETAGAARRLLPETMERTLTAVRTVKSLCDSRGIRLVVLCPPLYGEELARYDREELTRFYTQLAAVTPYWDFLYTPVSLDSRYFYEPGRFRPWTGQMMLARMFDDETVYVPEGFGTYVTRETAAEHWAAWDQVTATPEEERTAQVPVLMYHHIGYEPGNGMVVTPERLKEQLSALKKAGFHTVQPEELAEFVKGNGTLPDNPVVITFDDGYLSNYQYAYPLLKENGQCAAIFTVGVTLGSTDYKDTSYHITPHFTYAQAAEMAASGVISIQSHTFDMHQWPPYERGRARDTVLRWPGETERDYRIALTRDCAKLRAALPGGETIRAMAYPEGRHDPLAETILLENGFDITFTTQPGTNTLVRGVPQSLLCLNRYTAAQEYSGAKLAALLSAKN